MSGTGYEDRGVFICIQGSFSIELRDSTLALEEEAMVVIPGIQTTRPVCPYECSVMLIEPKGTVTIGTSGGDFTATALDRV